MKKLLYPFLILFFLLSACGPSKASQAKVFIDQADQLVEEEKYTQAIVLYNKAIDIDENSSLAYSGRGTVYRLLENVQEAFADLNKAIKLDENNYAAYRERGMVFYQTGDNTSALQDCNKAVLLNSNYALGHLCLAYLGDAAKNYDTAYSEYTKTINLDPKRASAYARRGEISLYNYQKYDEAVDDFSEAIKLKPGWAVYYDRASAYFYLGKYSDSTADYQKVLSLGASGVYKGDSYQGIADNYFKQKDYSNAIQYYTSAIENYSPKENPASYINRAISYDESGSPEDALNDYEKFLELDQTDTHQTRYACSRANTIALLNGSILNLLFGSSPCNRFADEGQSDSSPGFFSSLFSTQDYSNECPTGVTKGGGDECASPEDLEWDQQWRNP